MFFVATWIQLETVNLSKLMQKHKTKYLIFLQGGDKYRIHMDIKIGTIDTGDY